MDATQPTKEVQFNRWLPYWAVLQADLDQTLKELGPTFTELRAEGAHVAGVRVLRVVVAAVGQDDHQVDAARLVVLRRRLVRGQRAVVQARRAVRDGRSSTISTPSPSA